MPHQRHHDRGARGIDQPGQDIAAEIVGAEDEGVVTALHPIGGSFADSRSCSSGSCGASTGASSAASTNIAVTAAPIQSRAPPRFKSAIIRDGGAATA